MILFNKRYNLRFNVCNTRSPAFAKRRPDRQGLHKRQTLVRDGHSDVGLGGLDGCRADLTVLRNADNSLKIFAALDTPLFTAKSNTAKSTPSGKLSPETRSQ